MKNDKITIKEFWNSKKKLAIHCNTEEKADKLLEAFDKFGEKWKSGNRYTKFNCWCDDFENTCYSNTNRYSSIDSYKRRGYTIYEFEDVIFEEDDDK